MYQQHLPASLGAQRWRRYLTLSLLLMAGWLLAGCGGGGSSGSAASGGADSGEVLITLTDAEGDFIAYTVDVASITLEHADGRIVETLPNSARIDFAQYVDLTELFTAAQVPNGAYVGGSITLDYTNADVQVEVDGVAVPAPVMDADGNLLSTFTLDVRLEDQHRLIVAPGRPALLSIDFDLAASHRVDTSTPVPSVVAAPFLVADIEPVDEKELRVRGPLIDVNIDESSYTVRLRPWHRRDGDFGRARVNITDDTEFEIDGEDYVGAEGLRALDAAGAGTPTLAFGTLVTTDRAFTAERVLAGSSVPGIDFDAVFGNVTARNGNELTVRGATVIRRSGSVVFNDDVTVTVGDETIVKKPGTGGQNQGIAAVSVGQRVIVFGEVTSDPAQPGIEMDATQGRIRMRYTRLTGTANSIMTEQLNIDLQAIDRRRVNLFNFSGTGTSGADDANPDDYEVATGTLNTDFVVPQTPVRVLGFVTPFGAAPPDFEGRTIVDVALARAILGVGWGIDGTTSPFLQIDPVGLVIDLDNPDLGERQHIRIGDAIIPLSELVASPTIIGKDNGRRRFAILQGHRVQVFRDFGRFVATLNELLDGSTALRSLYAKGAYDATMNTVEATIIGAHVITPETDTAE